MDTRVRLRMTKGDLQSDYLQQVFILGGTFFWLILARRIRDKNQPGYSMWIRDLHWADQNWESSSSLLTEAIFEPHMMNLSQGKEESQIYIAALGFSLGHTLSEL